MKQIKRLCLILVFALLLGLCGCSVVEEALDVVGPKVKGYLRQWLLDEEDQPVNILVPDATYISIYIPGSDFSKEGITIPDSSGGYFTWNEDDVLIWHGPGEVPADPEEGNSGYDRPSYEGPNDPEPQPPESTPAPTRAPQEESISWQEEERNALRKMENRTLELINEYRAGLGLAPLNRNSYLDSIAHKAHSYHDSLEQIGPALVDPAKYSGTRFAVARREFDNRDESFDGAWSGDCWYLPNTPGNAEAAAQALFNSLMTIDSFQRAISDPGMQDVGIRGSSYHPTGGPLLGSCILFGGQ